MSSSPSPSRSMSPAGDRHRHAANSDDDDDEPGFKNKSNGYSNNNLTQESHDVSMSSTNNGADSDVGGNNKSDDEEDVPLSAKKVKRESRSEKRSYKEESDAEDDDEEDRPLSSKKKKKKKDHHSEKKDKKKEKNGVKKEPVSDDDDEPTNNSDDDGGDDSDYGSSSKKKKSKKSKKSKKDKKDKDSGKKNGKSSKESKKKRKYESEDEEDDAESNYDDDDYDSDSKKKKSKKDKKKSKKEKESSSKGSSKKKAKLSSQSSSSSPTKSPKKKVKEEDQEHIWKWWEEEELDENIKWRTLEHKGPVFAPEYVPLPSSVKFLYDGNRVKLSPGAEEVASFYGKMLDHDYTSMEVFNKNFFHDWRKYMNKEEKELIKDLKKCDFSHINDYFKEQSEIKKAMPKEDKKKLKEEQDRITEEYGYCVVDGHKQKIGNFRIEPPGLFRGRGSHPKMGKVKGRINSEDIIINIGKKAKVPDPPPGHKWKEVRHDNTVTWLASWNENIMNNVKYIMLNPSSKLKSMKDWKKYEKARDLHKVIENIRKDYINDWHSKEMVVRQRAVALYFIDRLALRAGNEKDDSEAADTVGCCSLRVEHIKLLGDVGDKKYVVEFDFPGKDSIRYYNQVPVEKQVFKSLKKFIEGKNKADDLFDRLTTQILNKHLNELMEGLTAKVFRTYNASITLQRQLDINMKPNNDKEMTLAEKVLAYNRANRSVAILCNHQRTVPKGFDKQMDVLRDKITAKEEQVEEAQKELKKAKKNGTESEKEKAKKKVKTLKEQLEKLKVSETDKEENKQIALGTSKLNYLDPRITVAWCKKYEVPLEKVYTKTHREKFRWAIEMAGPDYRFDH